MNEVSKKRSARAVAITAVFVALLIAVQYALSFVPGVELVTVSFTAFCCVFGAKRGMLSATAFSLLRQLVFGFLPLVLVLYLVYFNALALVMGRLGQGKAPKLWKVVLTACIATLSFTLLDNVLTPLWYGYSPSAFALYFKASIPFVLIQCACVGISTAVLFNPLKRIFARFAD